MTPIGYNANTIQDHRGFPALDLYDVRSYGVTVRQVDDAVFEPVYELRPMIEYLL